MANSKTTKQTPARTTQAKTTQNCVAATDAPSRKQTKLCLKDLDLKELVEVQSVCYGQLHYISREGYTVDWREFGDVQLMPVGELLKMRNQQPDFFSMPWVKPIGESAGDVIEYLQIGKYYVAIDGINNFDEIFSYDVEDFRSIVSKLSPALKEAVARRAYSLIQTGQLDSRKMIAAVEEVTGFSLS